MNLVTVIKNLQPFWKNQTSCSETTRSSFSALRCNWNKVGSYCGRGTACWQKRKALRALAIKAIWFPRSSTGGLTGCPFEADKGHTYWFWRCYRGSIHFLWGTSVNLSEQWSRAALHEWLTVSCPAKTILSNNPTWLQSLLTSSHYVNDSFDSNFVYTNPTILTRMSKA